MFEESYIIRWLDQLAPEDNVFRRQTPQKDGMLFLTTLAQTVKGSPQKLRENG